MGEVQSGVHLGESIGQFVQAEIVPSSGVDEAMYLPQVHVHAVVITEVVSVPAGATLGDVDRPVLPGPVVDVAEQVRVDRLEVVSVKGVPDDVHLIPHLLGARINMVMLKDVEFGRIRDAYLCAGQWNPARSRRASPSDRYGSCGGCSAGTETLHSAVRLLRSGNSTECELDEVGYVLSRVDLAL